MQYLRYLVYNPACEQERLAFSVLMKIQDNLCITSNRNITIHEKYLKRENENRFNLISKKSRKPV